MASLKTLLEAIHSDPGTDSAEEIKQACKLIIRVQSMTNAERDTIEAAYTHGPLFDGDLPSKEARDVLTDEGFIARVVVKGEDGFNACTHRGAWAYRLIKAGEAG